MCACVCVVNNVLEYAAAASVADASYFRKRIATIPQYRVLCPREWERVPSQSHIRCLCACENMSMMMIVFGPV